MKIVFAGTPEFAVKPLTEIVASGFCVVGVITQEDKPQGRKGILTAPPVKTKALELGLPVLQPHRIRDEVEAVKALGGDLLVTCAYGQILTQDVLDAFPMGVWNIHAGLLPAYRGASPIQSCILSGETETGVSVMKTELGWIAATCCLWRRRTCFPRKRTANFPTAFLPFPPPLSSRR